MAISLMAVESNFRYFLSYKQNKVLITFKKPNKMRCIENTLVKTLSSWNIVSD